MYKYKTTHTSLPKSTGERCKTHTTLLQINNISNSPVNCTMKAGSTYLLIQHSHTAVHDVASFTCS